MAEINEKAKLKSQIEEAEKSIVVAEAEITKAKTAGIDTADLEKELADAKASLEKLKEVYA